MIRIGICDDEKYAARLLERYIIQSLAQENITYKTDIFFSGEAILNYSLNLDIVFLDIEMPKMDGIDTGKKLREKNPNCIIIMATGIVERYKEAFHINAFRYVTKPFDEAEVREAVQGSLHKLTGKRTIEVFYNRVAYHVKEQNIYYVKAYNGYTLIRTSEREYRNEASLKFYESLLDERLFFKINRSCLVNLLKVKESADGIFFIGDEQLEVARRQKRDFMSRFIKADTKYR